MKIEIWHKSVIAGVEHSFHVGRAYTWDRAFELAEPFGGAAWAIYRVRYGVVVVLRAGG